MDKPSIIGVSAKIVIQKEFVMTGKVIQISDTHHIIESPDGRIREVVNTHVISVDPYKSEVYRSDVD